jgi:ParB family chromosome partitioning protein
MPKKTASTSPVEPIPLGQIEEDPNQPRKRFPADSLEELAANIEDTAGGSETPWLSGLLHPVVVYPNPAFAGEGETSTPRYRLFVGARRLRAFRHRGWPVIPARIVESPTSAARTIMTQLNENAGREATSLYEDARAVADAFAAWQAEHPDSTQQDFADAFGRSKYYVSRHLKVAEASGIALQALEEGHLNHTEAYRLFLRLPIRVQSTLLRSARRGQSPVSAGRIKAALRDLEREKAAATQPEPPASAEVAAPSPPPTPPASRNASPSREQLRILLSPAELRRILAALGAKAPKRDADLADALKTALDAS